MIENNFLGMYCYFPFHPIGQLCLGGPGYSSRIVTVGREPVRRIDTDDNAKLNIEHLFER